jgi:hypothetical protein
MPMVLAGYLVPEGQRWSREGARATAEHLEQVTDPQEHVRLIALAGQVLPDFFGRALACLVSSLTSTAASAQAGKVNGAAN